MAKVKFSFGSRAAFDRMAAKDPSTVYFVNETGDFSSASLDADGDIYLGEKILTGGGDGGGGAAAIPAVAGMPSSGVLQPNTLYQLGVLTHPLSVTLSSNFDESVKNEWRMVFLEGDREPGLTITEPSISGYTCGFVGGVGSLQAGHVYDIRILYLGSSEIAPTGFQTPNVRPRPPYKIFMVTSLCIQPWRDASSATLAD